MLLYALCWVTGNSQACGRLMLTSVLHHNAWSLRLLIIVTSWPSGGGPFPLLLSLTRATPQVFCTVTLCCCYCLLTDIPSQPTPCSPFGIFWLNRRRIYMKLSLLPITRLENSRLCARQRQASLRISLGIRFGSSQRGTSKCQLGISF